MMRYLFLFLALLLAACAPSAPIATTAPAPTAAPTAAPTLSPVALEATASVPGAQLLPAPLYVLELGQIARIERDGVTRAVLTAETVQIEGLRPIATFTVSSLGTIAYVVGDSEADRLVITDARGQGARILYEEAGHELSDLRFAPDGERLLFRLLNNRQPPDLPGGIYQIPVAGGAPQLLRADDPVDDPVNPARTLSGYAPLAFSPDGARLLVTVDSLFYEDCTVGTMPAGGGEVTRVVLPDSAQLFCGQAGWSSDGLALLFLAGPRESVDAGPNLWRADPSTGIAAPLMAPATFVRGPLSLPDGAVRFFLANVERDTAGTIVGASFVSAELAAGASTPTPRGDPFPELIARVLWAPDGAGAAAELGSDTERSLLRWIPFGEAPITLPSSEDGIAGMAWGVE